MTNNSPAAESRSVRVLVAAGGTGGHIMPGLALGRALQRQGATVRFMGTPRGLEGKLIPAEGFELDLVPMLPLSRSIGWRIVLLPFVALVGAFKARAAMRRHDIDVVVSMGGYAGVPACLGARLARRPLLLHESGAVPGRANLLCARLSKRVALAFPSAASAFSASTDKRVVGMPMSETITTLDRQAQRREARVSLDLRPDAFVVLVNGGSQGSLTLESLAVQLGERWRERSDTTVIVKAGKARVRSLKESVANDNLQHVVRVVDFLPSIEAAYAACDLAVCRAGAGTVAELAVVGLPAVLVPYPFAPDDHQAKNASELVEAGAAVLVRDPQATGAVVGSLLDEWRESPDIRAKMAAQGRALGRSGAADELASWALSLANPTGART